MAADNDERELIRRSRLGQAEAFTALVSLHQRMVHSLTYRMTGSMAEAEDLAQEAFIRAWQHMDSFNGDSKFSTWLCRIAMNGCLNWRQRESQRGKIHERWASDTWNASSDEGGRRAGAELSRRVQEALNRLPVKQRAAIVLTVYEEMNHAEAARALGCTEATISWRVFSARTKLKRWLKHSDHE